MIGGVDAEISIVGELNPDMILYGLPRDLPEEREILSTGFTLTLGSSSAILAHNLALLGTRVTFTACIGSDIFAKICCQMLREAGVDLSHMALSPAGVNTGVTVILPLETTRRILTYPGAMFELGIEQLDLDHLATAKHFHLSSLFLHRKLSPDIPKVFAEMKRRGLSTSLDTNDDPEQKWDGIVDDVLKMTDILFCTEQELVNIAKIDDLDAASHALSARVPLMIVKRGSHGASGYRDGRRLDVGAFPVPVIDLIGAGDSFDAGFLHQWIRGEPLESCLFHGNLAGALSVTRPGGTEAFRDTAHRQQFFARYGANAG